MMLEKIELRNGTTIIVNEIKTARSISCYGYFPYGVSTEKDDQIGITHLLEHLMFSGLEQYPTPIKVAQAFEEIGAVTDAVTFRDMVTCGIQCEIDSFPEGFKLLSEVLVNAKFTPVQVEIEKRVLKEELDYYSSEPEFSIWGSISETLWGENHCLGRRVEGQWDKVSKLSYDDLLEHYNKYYNADQLTLIITGAINENQLNSLFSEFEQTYSSKKCEFTLPKVNNDVIYKSFNHFPSTSEMAWVGIGFPFQNGNLDRIMIELIEILLTEGNASLLQQSMREDKGLLYNLTSESNTSRYGGEYALSFCTNIYKWKEISEIIKTEIVQAIEFSERNFEIAKRRLTSKIAFETESTKHHSRLVGRNHMIHNSLMDSNYMKIKLSEISSDELRDEMNKIFTNNNMSISLISKEVI